MRSLLTFFIVLVLAAPSWSQSLVACSRFRDRESFDLIGKIVWSGIGSPVMVRVEKIGQLVESLLVQEDVGKEVRVLLPFHYDFGKDEKTGKDKMVPVIPTPLYGLYYLLDGDSVHLQGRCMEISSGIAIEVWGDFVDDDAMRRAKER